MTSPASPDLTLSLEDHAKEAIEEIAVLLRGHTGRDDERRILTLLADLDGKSFRQTLHHTDLYRLLSDIDDVRFGVKHHQQLLELIAQERAADLDTAARVRFVRALQRGLTRRIHEMAIRDIFRSVTGDALTQLKDELDIGAGHHDLSQLLFSDVDSASLREEILDHIRTQSPSQKVGRKVLSDVDDTFYANWTDARYPKKTVYPGVRAFYRVLARRHQSDHAGVTFLTARPADRAGIVENRTHASLQERGLTLASTVLGGDLFHLHSHARIAKKKVENFDRYRLLFPEYAMVFVGDSGQGDAEVGRSMLGAAPDVMDGVFIHDVRHAPAEERKAMAKDGVYFFDTYLGAALVAHDLGLIVPPQVETVSSAVTEEFESVPFDDDEMRAAREQELEADRQAMAAKLFDQ